MRERTIIFATNLQDDVQEGVHLATKLALQQAATLVFLHVIPLSTEDSVGMLSSGVELFSGRKERQLQGLLPDHPGVPYRHMLRVGDPLSEIVDATKQEGADMMVLCARKRPFWSRFLGQGLLEKLQCRVSCPVVTYHAQTPKVPQIQALRQRGTSLNVLEALLDARTNALLSWLALQHDAVKSLSQRKPVQDGIVSLIRGRHWSLNQPFLRQIEDELRLELRETQQALGALGVELYSPYCDAPILRIGQHVPLGPSQRQWLQRLPERGGAGVSLPLPSDGGCVLLSGACVPLADGRSGILLCSLDAHRDFFRILAQPGPTPSTETYAFDQDGLMLSYSRFPDQLRQVGLLPAEPGAQTPCRLHLCDPGYNLLREDGVPGASLQLTKMAAAATAGEDGHDWVGYRDYRGVPVVGAWRWLPEYGFGIAAEMDATSVV